MIKTSHSNILLKFGSKCHRRSWKADEPQPQHKETITTLSKLIVGPAFTEAGIKVL
jgi:hypothetical protein